MAEQEAPQTEPKLDKPGAGVPFLEWAFLRYYVGPFMARRSDWDKNWEIFDDVNRRIYARIDNLSAAQLEKKVLIPRLQAIEDSSRYWSIAMTLEHLVIVGSQIEKLILSLSQGVAPPGKADTASVKPKGGKDGLVQLAEYKKFVAGVKPMIEPVRDAALKSNAKFSHPWMGPFTALQWQWLFGGHTHIHYRQIKEILKGL
jgi:hypothetical protein